MSSLLTRCSLVVPLVWALMIRADLFAVQSIRNKLFISNVSVEHGQNVTLDSDSGKALYLAIDPPVEPASFNNHTIFDENTSLYVGVEGTLSTDNNLAWVTEAYYWMILKTTKNTYVAFPPGQNFFWYDGNSAGSTTGKIGLAGGQESVELDGIEWDIKLHS